MKKLTSWLALISLWLCCTVVAHAGTHHYYYTDPQGTVLAKADASGTIIATYDYAPYGTAVASMSPAPNGPGYTGHVNDPESGLVYMQARYYDPAIGRFLSVDPIGSGAGNLFGINRFSYVSNNPVTLIDPTGMEQKHPNDMHICDTTAPCSDGFTVNWSKIEKQVDQVFDNYTVSKNSGNGVYTIVLTEKPIELRMALTYILVSPMGQKVARQAIDEGKTINFLEIPSALIGKTGFGWDPGSGFIHYTLDMAALKAQYKGADIIREIDVPLDVMLLHEIAHTWIGREVFGITAPISTQENEFEDVRRAENPYRNFYGIPLRQTYSGAPVPKPIIQ